MIRAIVAVLIAAACASCTYEPRIPDIWSLAMVEPGKEVYLGGHHSFDDCRQAGFDWLEAQPRHQSYTLQCRLNCRKLAEHELATCEATEPLG
jgi:hypothetical protein